MTDEQFDGSWDAERRTKREAWAAMTPTELLAWLEEALDLALATGALASDRRRRQRKADELARGL